MAVENILIADDEPLVQDLLSEVLKKEGYEVTLASDGYSALKKIQQNYFDVLITDVRMPKIDGITLLKKVKELSPSTSVIVITAYGCIEDAVEAMKGGACDYITKPVIPEQIKIAIQKISQYQEILRENRYLRSEIENLYTESRLIGESPLMKKVYRMIAKAAPTKSTVLIYGETGTGKELVARAIHYTSPRKKRPFVKVNCAAVPEELLESELFGYEKGAFTGATEKKEGRFELAHTGTLLLDEISETSQRFQTKLLRVLQEEEFERVGGTKTIKVDVRIIATTNVNPAEAVKKGKMREDLYYRLNVIPIYLPPLRERKEDIPLLVKYFLKKYNRQNGRKIKGITPECFEVMNQYTWPGNVRELENAIQRAVVISEEEYLRPEDLFLKVSSEPEPSLLLDTITLEEMERKLIQHTLQKVNGNRTKAAKILGVSVRTIRNKIKKYHLVWENFSCAGEI